MDRHLHRNVLRVLNRQTACDLDSRFFSLIARVLLEEMLGRRQFELGVHFVGAGEMTTINETFLRHEGSTDVITFNHGDGSRDDTLHGEIFICVDEAVIQGRRFRVSLQTEIARYLVHGVLHLEGWEDKKPGPRRKMKLRENKLLKALSRRFDLSRLRRDRRTAGSHERK